MPERHKIFDNPFRPFAEQIAPDNRISTLEQRAEKAEAALHAARRDLAAERERSGLAAEVDVEAARRKERKRIHAIMTSPVAALEPVAAWTFALRTDTSAKEAVELMEKSVAELPEAIAKVTADAIVNAGKMARGEIPAPVTGVGPKTLVKTSAEQIILAGKKARGEI